MRRSGTAKCKFYTQSYTLSVTWDDATLEAVVRELRERRGDSTGIEVKSAAGGVPSLGDTLCAFSNLGILLAVVLPVNKPQSWDDARRVTRSSEGTSISSGDCDEELER